MSKSLRNKFILVAILLIAVFVRFYAIEWGVPGVDQPRAYHPDERMAPLVLSRMVPAKNNFDPLYFINPSFHYYLYGIILSPITRAAKVKAPWQVGSYSDFLYYSPSVKKVWYLTGRILSALMGVLTVLGVFLLVRRLTGNEALALLSAGFLSIYPAHVIQSHYMVVDVPAVMWTVFALYVFLIALDSSRIGWAIAAGFVLGLGVSTKYTVVMIALPMIIFAAMKSWKLYQSSRKKSNAWRRPLFILSLCGLFSIAGFIFGTPYSVLDLQQFLGESGLHGIKKYNTFGFSLTTLFDTLFFYGSGLPMMVLGLAGTFYMVFKKESRLWPLAIFVLLNMAILIFNASGYMRHFVPMTPFLSILAAAMILDGLKYLSERKKAYRMVYSATIVAFGLYTLLYTTYLLINMGGDDPRNAASKWIKDNAKKHELIAVIAPEWGEDFFSVVVDRETYTKVAIGREYDLFKAYQPDYMILNEYLLKVQDISEKTKRDILVKNLETSKDYSEVMSSKRKDNILGIPIFFDPPTPNDWIYFCPEIRLFKRNTRDSLRTEYIKGYELALDKKYVEADEHFIKSLRPLGETPNPAHIEAMARSRYEVINSYVAHDEWDKCRELMDQTIQYLQAALAINPRVWSKVELTMHLSRYYEKKSVFLPAKQ